MSRHELEFRKRTPADEGATWNRPDVRCVGVPAIAPILIGESRSATAVLTSIAVFPSGIELRMLVEQFRSTGESDEDWRKWEDRLRAQAGSDVDPSRSLKFTLSIGKEYVVSTDQEIPHRSLDYIPLRPVLVRLPDRGRAGNARIQTMELRMWTYPQPPSGPMTVLLDWPEMGIHQHESDLGFVDINALANRVLHLRPESALLDP